MKLKANIIKFIFLVTLLVSMSMAFETSTYLAATDRVDQVQDDYSDYDGIGLTTPGHGLLAQTFKPSVTGKLTRIEVWFKPALSGYNDSVVNLELKAGEPNGGGAILAAKNVALTTDNGAWYNFQFDSPVSVQGGETFSILLTATSLVRIDVGYSLPQLGVAPGPYADGDHWDYNDSAGWVTWDDGDIAFRTYMMDAYTVTFNVDGGSPPVPNQSVESGGYATVPSSPTKTGHTFNGWYTDTTFSTPFNFSSPITQNTTIYAKWNSTPIINLPSSPTIQQNSSENAITGISIANVDGDSQTVTLSVTNGIVTLGTTSGLSSFNGNGTNNFSLSGTVANINSALASLVFTPTTGFYGTASITVSTDDGNGGTASQSLSINVQQLPILGGTVSITGEAKYGSTLTADISGITYTPTTSSDEPTYQWNRGGAPIGGATNSTYTIVEADIAQIITVTVTADGTNATGSVTSSGTSVIEKADGPVAPNAPIEESKTSRSVTLVEVADQEYSQDNGATWQDSSTFSGLSPDTEYTFITRVKETSITKPSSNSIGKTIRTEALPEIGGAISITGATKYDSTLTVDTSGINYTPATSSDVPTYQWNRGGTPITGATNSTYTIVADDIGEVLTVTIMADGTNATGSVTSSPTDTIEKADGPSTPSSPVEESKTPTSVTLVSVVGQEYSQDGGTTWQDSATFTSLTPETAYTFTTRIKETNTHKASPVSSGITVITPAIPVMGGTVGITGDAKYGSTLSVNISGITYTPTTSSDVPTYQWNRGGTPITGATNSTYTIVEGDIGEAITVTVTADGTNAVGSVTSDPTVTVEKADGPSAPGAPVESSKTPTSVTLVSEAGQEYSLDGGTTWQDSATFTGLTPETSYTFITRVKETTTHKASPESNETTITTPAIPVMGGTVNITGEAKYESTLTADTTGITYTPTTSSDAPTYQWNRGGTPISGATNATYTIVEGDIGEAITVTVTADGTNAVGSVTSSLTDTIEKADGPSAPSAPVEESKTPMSVTLVSVAGHEYSQDGGTTWQDSATFTSLIPETVYTFITRIKETNTHKASPVSSGITVTTPAIPILSGTVTIIGDTKYSSLLTADISGITYTPSTSNDVPTYQWNRGGIVISGATNATYTLVEADIGSVITVTITADRTNAVGSVTSEPTGVVEKFDGPSTPSAPVESSKTATSITLVNVPGQEYSRDNGNTWQDSSIFSGLTAATEYTFITRVKETPTHKSSLNSSEVTIRTSTQSSGGGGSSSPTTPGTETITVIVEDGNAGTTVSETTIERTTTPYGKVKDIVTLTEQSVTETIGKLLEQGSDTARIVIPDTDDKVSQVDINIPKEAAKKLGDANVSLEIKTPNVIIQVPQSSLDGFDEELYFRVTPLKEQDQKDKVRDRAKAEEKVKELSQGMTITVLGRPMTIETNMQSRPVTLTLPVSGLDLPTNVADREKFLANLVIFIEHSDGEKALIKPNLVQLENGEYGLHFEVNKFSTFTILEIEGLADSFHAKYISGYPDGTFKPSNTVTRAEIAAMIARNLGYDDAQKGAFTPFPDVQSSHWASGAIEFVKQQGLMMGDHNRNFNPNAPITRAEIATIVARYKELTLMSENDSIKAFPDISGHWAVKEIAANKQAGIIGGYPDGSFKPNGKLTRAEAVKVMNRMFDRGPLYGVTQPTFKDVPTNHWAFTEVEEAAQDHFFTPRPAGGENIIK